MKRTLLDLLFPRVRAELLRLLFTNPGQELYVRELSRLSFLALRTVQDELINLSRAGLIVSRSDRRHRFYRANPKHPLYSALRRVVVRAGSQRGPSPLPPRLPKKRRAARQRTNMMAAVMRKQLPRLS